MENLVQESSRELVIYGKEELLQIFDNNIERNIFVSSLYKEFKDVADEITIMRITNELTMVKIQTDYKIISRLYRKDGKYVDINGQGVDEDALKVMSISNIKESNIKERKVEFPDNYGNYVKSLKDFVIPGKTLKMIQDYLFGGVNVLIKGGPGTGKTEFPQRLANQLKMKHLIVDCGTIKTPQDWFGTREYVEGEGTKFVESELIEYLQQPSIIILDEINRTTPDCHNSIFRILDGNRKVNIMALKRTINVHPHCVILATMNEGRSHTGTYMMDSAITDRFEIFELDIPSKTQIVKLLETRFPTIDLRFLEGLAVLTHKINSLYNSEQLTVQVGLRPALSACVLLEKDNVFLDVLNQSFVGRFSSEGGSDSEATLIKQAYAGLISRQVLKSKNSTISGSYDSQNNETFEEDLNTNFEEY